MKKGFNKWNWKSLVTGLTEEKQLVIWKNFKNSILLIIFLAKSPILEIAQPEKGASTKLGGLRETNS